MISPFSSSFTSRTSCRTSSTSLRFVANLCTPPKRVWTLYDETYSLTGDEPCAYDFKETYVESYTELLTSPPFSKQGFPEDAEFDDAALEDLLRDAHRVHVHHCQRETCLSVSRRRLCLRDRCDLLEKERGDLLSQVVRMHRLEFCWTDEKSEFLMCARQKLTDTFFKLITTEEVFETWVKLLNLGEKNFSALKLKDFNDEINSFFMDSYCSKIWNDVKPIRKVSVKWKNY